MKAEDHQHVSRLIARLSDGSIEPDEIRQLNEWLRSDPISAEAYLDHMEVDAMLMCEFGGRPQGASPVGGAAHAHAASASEDGQVAGGHGDEAPSPRRPVLIGLAAAVMAVAIGLPVVVWMTIANGRVQPTDDPQVVQASGDIEVQTADGNRRGILVGHAVRVGDSLEVAAATDKVLLRYADGTEIGLSGTASLGIARSPRGGKQLELRSGMLQADVAPQSADRPLLIVTPHTSVRVLGTRFELTTDEREGTQLELDSGRVELVRGSEAPVVLQPDSIAIVPSSNEPIRVRRRPAVISVPSRETDFSGLRSIGFAADGRTIVGSTRNRAVYWYEDDRLETVPVASQRDVKGVWFKQQSGSWLAYETREPRRLMLWDHEVRKPVRIFDDVGRLPRRENRPEGSQPPVNVPAMSPQGGWVAFQVGRLVRIWDTEDDSWPKYPPRYDKQPLSAMAASADGRWLALAIRRHSVEVVDALAGETTVSWPIKHVPLALEFSTSGEKLAAGFDGRVRIYDVSGGAEQTIFEQPGVAFLKVAVSADGRYVAASTLSHRIWLWDVTEQADMPLIDIGEPIRDLAFSPEGRQLAVASKSGLTLWEVVSSTSDTAEHSR